MSNTGYMKERNGRIFVGANDAARGYQGPQAEVSADKTWLHIITDPYEGVVMLNIEAAPHLIKAVRKAMREAG